MALKRQTTAIVLRTSPYAESDLIVRVLTPDQGKCALFAKAARKSKKRFRGGLRTFAILNITYSDKGRDRLAYVYESDVAVDFSSIGPILPKVGCGTYILDLCDLVLPDGGGETLYPPVTRYMRWLATEDRSDMHIELGTLRVQLMLLAEAGWLPDLERSAVSGEPIDSLDNPVFSWNSGVIDRSERDEGDRTLPLTRGCIEILRAAEAGRFLATDDPAVRRETRTFMNHLWCGHLNREVKSYRFMADVMSA